jgi:hypothetical protein
MRWADLFSVEVPQVKHWVNFREHWVNFRKQWVNFREHWVISNSGQILYPCSVKWLIKTPCGKGAVGPRNALTTPTCVINRKSGRKNTLYSWGIDSSKLRHVSCRNVWHQKKKAGLHSGWFWRSIFRGIFFGIQLVWDSLGGMFQVNLILGWLIVDKQFLTNLCCCSCRIFMRKSKSSGTLAIKSQQARWAFYFLLFTPPQKKKTTFKRTTSL